MSRPAIRRSSIWWELPKGRLSRLEKQLLDKPWQQAREGVAVKLLANDGELYVFAQSDDRVAKERAMRRRHTEMVVEAPTRADWQWKSPAKRCADEARCRAGQSTHHRMAPWSISRWTRKAPPSPTPSYRKKLRRARRREGRICCAPISTEQRSHAVCGNAHIQLVAVEQAFKT